MRLQELREELRTANSKVDHALSRLISARERMNDTDYPTERREKYKQDSQIHSNELSEAISKLESILEEIKRHK